MGVARAGVVGVAVARAGVLGVAVARAGVVGVAVGHVFFRGCLCTDCRFI